MNEKDKGVIALTTIVVFGILAFFAMVFCITYSYKKLETEQPRYFIEFKGNLYELKEVE